MDGSESIPILLQGRRRFLKSGTAIERHRGSARAEGPSRGRAREGIFLLSLRGVRGISPEKIFKFKMSVEAILMHIRPCLLVRFGLLYRHFMWLYSNVFRTPPLKNEQLYISTPP